MKSKSDDRKAALERENAELRRQLAESLAQQDAVSEVLEVIARPGIELAVVLQTVATTAHRLCRAHYAVIFRKDGSEYRWAAGHGISAAYEERERRAAIRPGAETIIGRAVLEGRAVQIDDALADPRYAAKEDAEIGGIRTMLGVPLMREGEAIGAIGLARGRVEPFTDRQIALVESFAAQAVIAMENARLLTETREALEQQTATAEVLQVINSSPGNPAPVFDAILEKAHRLCGATRGTLFLFDGETFRAAAMHGYPQGQPPRAIHVSEDARLASFLAGERFIHIPDLTKLDDPIARQVAERGGVRTNLLLPLRNDGMLRGVISCNREEVRPFSDKDIALLENFAAQAVIAIENARLITETRESLERQTATSDILRVIAASPGDAEGTLRKIAETTMRLFNAAGASFRIADGDAYSSAIIVGRGAEDVSASLSDPDHLVRPRTLPGTVIHENRQIHLPDLDNLDPAFADWPGPPVFRALGMRTLIGTPLRRLGRAFGALVVYRDELRPFAPDELQLLQSFADQAVIAMENARLITETREALEQQTATAEVLQVINSSPGDLAPVFEAMLDKALQLCDANFGYLLTYDGEGLVPVADRGNPAFSAWVRGRGKIVPEPGTINARIIDGGEDVVQVADVINDPFYQGDTAMRRAVVEIGGFRTVLTVALRKDGALLGVIHIYRQEVRPFSDRQIALLQNFAAQAVIAMENARLLGELRQRTEEVAELNRGLEARVAEQVDELGRVGRLKRFLAPQLAELIVSQGDEKILESHRREIVVVFCDLRGYTAFTETAEPEEVLDFLREYHGALGPLVAEFEGTLDQFSGDGIMVFFNDPVPIPDPAERAVKMAMAMREAAGALTAVWRRRGRELGFGAGIAQGYATLGQIGFSERSGYTAIGTVCNVAARLCAEAKDGQILIAQRVAAGLDGDIALEDMGPLPLKGITQPVVALNVAPAGAGAGRLRLIEP
ncbi:MAG: GAF domain-containing protein [Stellaceae bacterium]